MQKRYKIFLKEASVLITGRQDTQAIADPRATPWKKEDFFKRLNEMFKAARGTFIFYSWKPDEALEELHSGLTVIRGAGGVVWNSKKELLMIYRKGKWELPKGKIEDGEDNETAALREVQEECGITNLKLLKKLDSTYHIYKEKKEWFLKETAWFEMLYEGTEKITPQKTEGITYAKWLSENEVQKKLQASYNSIRDLLGKLEKKSENN